MVGYAEKLADQVDEIQLPRGSIACEDHCAHPVQDSGAAAGKGVPCEKELLP